MAAPKAKKIEEAPKGASGDVQAPELKSTDEEVKTPELEITNEDVQAPDLGPTLRMVKVENLKGTYFVQASTGLRIGSREVKLLADDSWLELQIRAGLLKKV